MHRITWNEGRLITLKPKDIAICNGTLDPEQLYCLFFYNASNNEKSATVTVVYGHDEPPIDVKVPGTTQDQGHASLCFVTGTRSVTVSVGQQEKDAVIKAMICSVQMPKNTAGIQNKQLPLDGGAYPIQKWTRYYAVPKGHWYRRTLACHQTYFIEVQMEKDQAEVIILNSTKSPSNVIYYGAGTQEKVTVKSEKGGSQTSYIKGKGGSQYIWMNAGNVKPEDGATITVESVSRMYEEIEG